jgi:hypothetical protein
MSMTRADFVAYMDQRLTHALQCQQRAVDARADLQRAIQYGRSLAKADARATAMEINFVAAKEEFLSGLYDAIAAIAAGRIDA